MGAIVASPSMSEGMAPVDRDATDPDGEAPRAGGAGGRGSAGEIITDGFTHPGILHTRADLERIKASVLSRTYPWYGAFLMFEADARSSLLYTHAPVAAIEARGYQRVRADAHAAYQNAIMWYVTRDSAHAATATRILDDWATTCTSWVCTANIDAYASALHFAAAAEILRYSPGSGWTDAHTGRVEGFLSDVIWPVLEGAYLGHGQNGCSDTPGDGNQGAGDIRGMMAIAIFANDRARFEHTVTAFRGDAGAPNRCVALAKEAGGYVDANGAPGEGGRDQPHPQGGVASYSAMAQMAWCQGIDLWAHGQNRILSAVEWFAKFNMGDDDVPFSNDGTCFNSYAAISSDGRGQWTMAYELAFNHYLNIKGLDMPFSEQLLRERLRPENGATDDPGFGTLLFSTEPDASPPAYDGVYKIINLNSGRALQTVGAAIGEGTGLEQAAWRAANEQQWAFTPLGSDYYRIARAGASEGLVIDSGSGPSRAGARAHLWTLDGGDNKIWKIVTDAEGGVRFVARDSVLMRIPVTHLVWDIADSSTADGGRLQMNAITSSASQRFTISNVLTPPNPGSVTAERTNTQTTIGWAPAPTATAYSVKRSVTSGGPYTTIAGSLVATAYTDVVADGDATYHYVVSAINASGEGPDSAQVVSP